MINPNDPPRGSMYLYDDITPATVDGSYKMTIDTKISYDTTRSAPIDRYFDVVGPRFTLDPTIVANVYPPRNGQGVYQDALPQAVLSRRTLPWERRIDSDSNPLPLPKDTSNLPNGQVPWVALLLFEEGEYALLQNQQLENVVPSHIFAALGSPPNILCDAIEVDATLLREILPTREELQLLSHVRQVNVEDRELSAGSSDGFFSVVMSNRLPAPDLKCRACLVSLEQRTDLVQADPPPFEYSGVQSPPTNHGQILGIASPILGRRPVSTTVRLVLLHSWVFTSTGPGTFRSLMQGLDVGMMGVVKEAGKPALTDTGHLRLQIQDRVGETETAWYRGPLVPWQLTRDSLGPYHSADQCRRASPETGAEDISYAAAFEVGRQLAAADARLAQELMSWRRESYRQAARADTISKVQAAIPVDLPTALDQKLHTPVVPEVSFSAAKAFATGAPPSVDRYGISFASRTVGMDPQALANTWSLNSPAVAQQILGGEPGILGAPVVTPPQTPRPAATLESVAADTADLARLNSTRDRLIENARLQVQINKSGGAQ